MKRQLLVASLSLLATFAVHAQEHDAHHPHEGQHEHAAMEMSRGEVRKVDRESGKLTIRHGPLANLDMPAMTMVFRVRDAALLDQVKVGDNVEFEADKVNGQLTVVRMEVLR